MPVVKTIKEGNVTTEIIDMTEGKGHLSTDEILNKTGGKAGQHVEVGPDGKTYTYSVEVEEVHLSYLSDDLTLLFNAKLCLNVKLFSKDIFFERQYAVFAFF